MFKKWLLKISNVSDKGSCSYRFRRKRMQDFERFYKKQILSNHQNEKQTILDLGGSLSFWETMEFKYFHKVSITLLNLEEVKIPDSYDNVFSVAGDATDLSGYADKSFDFVFSNSVIEHVGGFAAQRRMAAEMMRTGRHCYLQTPNRYFILEPHFLVPFFQFFPLKLRAFLIRHWDLGHMSKAKTEAEAMETAESVRLLTKKELSMLFPGVEIKEEKFLFMTKSFYLYF